MEEIGLLLDYKQDQLIYKENDYADCLYLIERGKVIILKQNKEKRLTPVGEMGAKEFLGVEGLLSKNKRRNSAIAMEATSLIKIELQDFHKFFQTAPEWQKKLFLNMTDRLESTESILAKHQISSEKLWIRGEFTPDLERKYQKIIF